MDVKADITSSLDSLSFSSLITVHDRQSKTGLNNRPPNHICITSIEFEFSTASPALISKFNKISPASTRNSTAQLVPRALQSQPKQAQVTANGSLPATKSQSKRSSDKHENNSITVSSKQDYELRSHSYRDHSVRSSSSGVKFFKSFVSPCRGCKAIEPTVKPLPRKDVKLH